MPRGGTPEDENALDSLFLKGSCEKIQNIWKARREGTPPPMIRKEFRAPLEARCPHRANFSPLQGVRGLSLGPPSL